MEADAFQAIEASQLARRMKDALRRVAQGATPTDPAAAVGYMDARHVRRAAARFGLRQVYRQKTAALAERRRAETTAALIESLRALASGAVCELQRRLEEEPESISTKDLVVAAGVAADKLAKWEHWGETQELVARATTSEALARLASALEGRTVQVSVAVTTDEYEPEGARQIGPGGGG